MSCVAVYCDGRFDGAALAMNLALAAITGSERHVLLWEFAEERSVAQPLGAAMRQYTQARRLFSREADMPDSIRSTRHRRLDILPAQATIQHLFERPTRADGREPLSSHLEQWHRAYDLVVVDCPANAADLSDEILELADLVVAPFLLDSRAEQARHDLAQHVARCGGRELLPLLAAPDWDAINGDLPEALERWPRVPQMELQVRDDGAMPPSAGSRGDDALPAFALIWTTIEQKLLELDSDREADQRFIDDKSGRSAKAGDPALFQR